MDLQESYKILELEKTSCLQEVKQAYRDIVFIWHPDRLESNQRMKKKAEKKLQEINLAYEILQNHLSGKLPEFVKIIISPESVELKYHESKIFTVFGIDSRGKKTEIERVKWESSGGVIYQDGLFFADDKPANYTITASFSTFQAEAKVKLIKGEKVPKKTNKSNGNNSLSISHKIKAKLNQYWQSNPLVKKFIAFKQSLIKFFILIKWILWGCIGWIIMTDNYLYDEATNVSTRFASILFISWVIGIIAPNLVINFGMNKIDSDSLFNSRAKVSVFYSMLTSIFLGLAQATSPLLPTENFNSIQNWILGFSAMAMIFTFSYPQGSPMASMLNKAPKQNRFTAGSGCFFMGLFFIAIIGLFR